jgi:hypothetical protein
MSVFTDILEDYENLIGTQVIMPLDNGDIIKFTFQRQNLPHLLGLQYLVDIPILFEYKEGRKSATAIYKGMKDNTIETEKFEDSNKFDKIYEGRLKYFNSNMIMEIIKSKQLVKFFDGKVKDFDSKLKKVDYMFWKRMQDEDGTYGYFGVGFTTSEEEELNYPNTFFFRADNQYVIGQDIVNPLSLKIKNKEKNIEFEIYWDIIRKCMQTNNHYKKIASYDELIDSETNMLDEEKINELGSEDIKAHYRLLKLDEMDKAYLPHMKDGFRWTNQEKMYLLEDKKAKERNYLPNKIQMLLNEFKQKIDVGDS